MLSFKDSHDVQYGEYKNSPTIGIPIAENKDGEVFYMSMGVKKAKKVLEYIDDIERFVIANEGK
jgi:hypothetical protein